MAHEWCSARFEFDLVGIKFQVVSGETFQEL